MRENHRALEEIFINKYFYGKKFLFMHESVETVKKACHSLKAVFIDDLRARQ